MSRFARKIQRNHARIERQAAKQQAAPISISEWMGTQPSTIQQVSVSENLLTNGAVMGVDMGAPEGDHTALLIVDQPNVQTINHWGVWVSSDTPIGGVINNNNVEFLSEEINKGIDLEYEAWHDELMSDPDLTDDQRVYAENSWEGDNSGDVLIGGWNKDADGKYEPDKESEFAAIVGEIYTQVVWSKTTKLCNLCSPCYPGQGDLDSVGIWLAYDLPADMYGAD